MSDIVERLRSQLRSDHVRGCQGRCYTCDCGYDLSTEGLLEMAADEIESLQSRIRDLENALRQFVVCCDTAPPTSLMIEIGMACETARVALWCTTCGGLGRIAHESDGYGINCPACSGEGLPISRNPMSKD